MRIEYEITRSDKHLVLIPSVQTEKSGKIIRLPKSLMALVMLRQSRICSPALRQKGSSPQSHALGMPANGILPQRGSS
jgi:hypothetical protein